MRKNAGIAHILVILVVLVAGILAFFFIQNKKNEVEPYDVATPIQNEKSDTHPGWARFTDNYSNFSIDVPPGWTAEASNFKKPLTTLASADQSIRITISKGSKLTDQTLEEYYLEPGRYLNHGEYEVKKDTPGEFRIVDKTYGEAPPEGNERILSFIMSPEGYVFQASTHYSEEAYDTFDQIISTITFEQ